MLAWLGGVAIVVGIALFFLFAVSRGWIGESARVLGGGVGSLALLVSGVWLHERRGQTDAARTMVAVAIAGLFMTFVVASRVYAVMIAQTRLRISDRELAPALFCVAWLAALYLGSVLIITALHTNATDGANAVLELTVGQRGQMLLSGLWGISGVSALILGLRRDHRLLRQTALGVLLVTAGKVFLYDLSTLESVYRIASFIGLGLLLLAGAYAYQRLRPPPPPDLRTVPRALR